MNIRLLQLNIEKGTYLKDVVSYIKSGDFDIVCLQEVTTGMFSPGRINTFDGISKKTGLEGQLAKYLGRIGDTSSFFANATFYTKEWSLVSSHIIWLKPYREVKELGADFSTLPRCALALLLKKGDKKLLVINTHLAWGPTPDDAAYKRNQAEKLYTWMKNHRLDPFVLTGDFNLNPRTMIVTKLGSLGNNLTNLFHITNTLNPRTHRVKALFPSGIAVDYIITDKRLDVKKFAVVEKDLSDHFGLVTEFSL